MNLVASVVASVPKVADTRYGFMILAKYFSYSFVFVAVNWQYVHLNLTLTADTLPAADFENAKFSGQ